jgi:hypothetical protein
MTIPHPRKKKRAITVRLDIDLIATYQDFIRYHAGHPFYLTHASFITDAIRRQMDYLNKDLAGNKLEIGELNHRAK